MKISKKGLDLIKQFEGFRSKPYLDVGGVPTIGYGTTHYVNGRKVTMEDHDISEEVAEELLRTEVNAHYAPAVDTYLQVPVSQDQFDALVSFTYNIGVQGLKGSTLLKKINSKASDDEIADEFMKWIYVDHKPNTGLMNRRTKEKELYLA